MKNSPVVIAILLIALFAGCASDPLKVPSRATAHFTRHGTIWKEFIKQPDGSYKVIASGPESTPDDVLVKFWRDMAAELAKDRVFEGSPQVEIYEYTQGYVFLQPYAPRDTKRTGKRAIGQIRISDRPNKPLQGTPAKTQSSSTEPEIRRP